MDSMSPEFLAAVAAAKTEEYSPKDTCDKAVQEFQMYLNKIPKNQPDECAGIKAQSIINLCPDGMSKCLSRKFQFMLGFHHGLTREQIRACAS